MNNKTIYKAAKIFTGNEMLHNHCIVASNGLVETILPAASIATEENIIDEGDCIIAPAFIDIQLYGAYNRLLSVYPDAETVTAIHDYCAAGGAAYSLPTVATNTYDIIFRCVDAIKNYWKNGGKGIIGLHVEGPWISKARRGAHREEWIFSPTLQQVQQLLDYGKGVIKIITLAPEECSQEIIDLIHSYNIVVSAGHSNATYEQATTAFNNGIRMGTHLFNAMSPLQHRAPGVAGAILNHASVLCSLVPDGYHVDFSPIQIAKKIMGKRLFAITDAVTTTTEGYYQHVLEGDKYTSNGILSGSALTMHKCFKNFVFECNIGIEEALRMCSLYPAQALQMENKIGCLQKKANASFIVLDTSLALKKMIEA